MSHTKGPWILDEAYGNPEILHGGYHAITAGQGFYGGGERDTGFELSAFMKIEDARLIAAAPELLESLERIVNCAYNIGGEHVTDQQPLIDAADAAMNVIARAKGESA